MTPRASFVKHNHTFPLASSHEGTCEALTLDCRNVFCLDKSGRVHVETKARYLQSEGS
jgi:hypothetical protein